MAATKITWGTTHYVIGGIILGGIVLAVYLIKKGKKDNATTTGTGIKPSGIVITPQGTNANIIKGEVYLQSQRVKVDPTNIALVDKYLNTMLLQLNSSMQAAQSKPPTGMGAANFTKSTDLIKQDIYALGRDLKKVDASKTYSTYQLI